VTTKNNKIPRFLIAPDKFKGSLPAGEVANAIMLGLRKIWPGSFCRVMPLADGGEGTVEILTSALGGEIRECDSTDALGRPIKARWGWVPSRALAVVECGDATGLWRIETGERDVWHSHSGGTGRCLLEAAKLGAQEVYLGLGGSATNDSGAGLAHALGWIFLDEGGRAVDPFPANFSKIRRAQPPEKPLPFRVTALADVQNPLMGQHGATAVFAPQKGLAEKDHAKMEQHFRHFLAILEEHGFSGHADTPGAGAAGGMGFGVLAFCRGGIRSGFDVIAEVLDLERAVQDVDVVITGEGKVDSQTLQGKGPAGVAGIARANQKPVVIFAGQVDEEESLNLLFDAVIPLPPGPLTVQESMKNAGMLLEKAAARFARTLNLGTNL